MTNTSLPVALECLLHSLSETSTISSWNVLGTGYMTTLVIRWDCSDALVLNIERNLRPKSGVTRTVHRRSMKTLEKEIQNTEHDSRTQRQTRCVNCSIVQPGALLTMRTGDTLTWVTV